MPREITLDETDFRKAWDAGIPIRTMAGIFGCSTHTIRRISVKLNCTKRASQSTPSSTSRHAKKERAMKKANDLQLHGEVQTKPRVTLSQPKWETDDTPRDTHRAAWQRRVAEMAAQGIAVTKIARDLQCLPIDVANEVERSRL